MGTIADGGDGRQDVGKLDPRLVPAHTGASRRKVDLDTDNTGKLRHMLFVEPDTGRAGNPLDDQRRFALGFTQAAHEALLEIGMIIELQPVQNRRQCLAPRLGQGIAIAVVVGQPVIDNRLRHGLTTDAAHRLRPGRNGYRQLDTRRNRQPAVIAIRLTHWCPVPHPGNKKGQLPPAPSDANEYKSVP